MYTVVLSRDFKRSFKKLQRSGTFSEAASKDYKYIIDLLVTGQSLPLIYRDHALVGEYLGYRECHIKGDLLLVYQILDDQLVLLLIDIGSHSYLFG